MSEIMPSVGPDPRDLTIKGRRTRATILAAARAVFGRAGRDAISHAAIAAEAGIGRGTVYRYYPQIDEILDNLETEAERHVSDLFLTRFAGRPHGAGRLRSCLTALLIPELRDDGLSRLCLHALRDCRVITSLATAEIRTNLRADDVPDADVLSRMMLAMVIGLLDAVLKGRIPIREVDSAVGRMLRMARL